MKLGGLGAMLVLVGSILVSGMLFRYQPEADRRSPEPPLTAVQVIEVEPQVYVPEVRVRGTVRASAEGELVGEVFGRVVWISPALAGGRFARDGETLIRLDPTDYAAAVDRAEALHGRSQSEAELARAQHARTRALVEHGVASSATLERDASAARVAEARVREARVDLEQARRDLSRTEIRAPYDSLVVERTVDLGQFVSRGVVLAKLHAIDYVEIRLPITERELAILGPRGLALLRDSEPLAAVVRGSFAGADHEWAAEVLRLEGQVDERTRMVNLVARVDDPYGRHNGAATSGAPPLAIGTFVEARIPGAPLEDVFLVPRTVIRSDETVLVVGEDDRLATREVDVVLSDGERAVVGAGLAAGDRLCLCPPGGVREGTHVRVAREPSNGESVP